MTQGIRACDRCGADISDLHGNARRCKTCPKRPALGGIPARPCAICNISYTPKRRDSTCCSRACNGLRLNRLYAAQVKAARTELPCPGCGGNFTPWRTDQRYCTPVCGNRRRARANYRPANLTPRPCARCSVTFAPKQTSSIYCSRICSRRATYTRYRQERIAKAVAWARANPTKRAAIATQNKARRRHWAQTNPGSVGVTSGDWLKLVRRYRHRCAYCGGNAGGIHMDHVIPISRRGPHAIGNVLPACQACNLSKGAKLLTEWRRR